MQSITTPEPRPCIGKLQNKNTSFTEIRDVRPLPTGDFNTARNRHGSMAKKNVK